MTHAEDKFGSIEDILMKHIYCVSHEEISLNFNSKLNCKKNLDQNELRPSQCQETSLEQPMGDDQGPFMTIKIGKSMIASIHQTVVKNISGGKQNTS